MLSPRGKYPDDAVPPMWHATAHDGFILQRTPRGWTILVRVGHPGVAIGHRDITLGAAKAAATARRISSGGTPPG